ncbi:hypothetical protein [Lonepinella sp. BR2271]|uniref:hypothetical protein n=1 Tax=Lonepinella sp. BR2271 TaxID=3434550 RepID=UPI003F6E3C21
MKSNSSTKKIWYGRIVWIVGAVLILILLKLALNSEYIFNLLGKEANLDPIDQLGYLAITIFLSIFVSSITYILASSTKINLLDCLFSILATVIILFIVIPNIPSNNLWGLKDSILFIIPTIIVIILSAIANKIAHKSGEEKIKNGIGYYYFISFDDNKKANVIPIEPHYDNDNNLLFLSGNNCCLVRISELEIKDEKISNNKNEKREKVK